MPGRADSCSCSNICPEKWYFSDGLCPRLFIKRRVNYFNPEIAKAKVHIFSQHPGVVRKNELIGAVESQNTITTVDEPTGEIFNQEIITQNPIYQTVEQAVNFVKHDVVNSDGSTQNPHLIKYHGVNA